VLSHRCQRTAELPTCSAPPYGLRCAGGPSRVHRGDRALTGAQHAEVTDAVPAVGDRDGEVAKDDSGIVRGAALSGRRHCL
jgi:hypothetical protein